jgi:hypothetical protein
MSGFDKVTTLANRTPLHALTLVDVASLLYFIVSGHHLWGEEGALDAAWDDSFAFWTSRPSFHFKVFLTFINQTFLAEDMMAMESHWLCHVVVTYEAHLVCETHLVLVCMWVVPRVLIWIVSRLSCA